MGIHHLDLAVSDLERSLTFYRELLGPLGYTGESTITGERGERVVYLGGHAQIGLRARQSHVPHDRYAVGVHHIAFAADSRAQVDERARWLTDHEVTIESGPREYDYADDYYAVFFYDPDGIKLDLRALASPHGQGAAVGSIRTDVQTQGGWRTGRLR